AKLTGASLKQWLDKLDSRKVNLSLPRFTVQTSYTLSQPLKNLGMKHAFSPEHANFKGMAESSDPNDALHIFEVFHKAFVQVNEEGTEAAAATGGLAAPKKKVQLPFVPEFRADHPFLFLIRDIDSGAILFMGRMTKP